MADLSTSLLYIHLPFSALLQLCYRSFNTLSLNHPSYIINNTLRSNTAYPLESSTLTIIHTVSPDIVLYHLIMLNMHLLCPFESFFYPPPPPNTHHTHTLLSATVPYLTNPAVHLKCAFPTPYQILKKKTTTKFQMKTLCFGRNPRTQNLNDILGRKMTTLTSCLPEHSGIVNCLNAIRLFKLPNPS